MRIPILYRSKGHTCCTFFILKSRLRERASMRKFGFPLIIALEFNYCLRIRKLKLRVTIQKLEPILYESFEGEKQRKENAGGTCAGAVGVLAHAGGEFPTAPTAPLSKPFKSSKI